MGMLDAFLEWWVATALDSSDSHEKCTTSLPYEPVPRCSAFVTGSYNSTHSYLASVAHAVERVLFKLLQASWLLLIPCRLNFI